MELSSLNKMLFKATVDGKTYDGQKVITKPHRLHSIGKLKQLLLTCTKSGEIFYTHPFHGHIMFQVA